MNKKLITVFLILTVIPVGLLGWLAVVGYRSEEDRNRRQIEALARERLTTVNLQIERYFENLESELLDLPNLYDVYTGGRSSAAGAGTASAGTEEASNPGTEEAANTETAAVTGTEDGGADALRRLVRNNYLFRQIFILGSDNTMLFPAEQTPLSEGERDFLARTKEIGMSRGTFLQDRSGTEERTAGGSGGPGMEERRPADRQPNPGTEDAADRAEGAGSAGDTSVPGGSAGSPDDLAGSSGGAAEYGWYTWYLGEGINFIFWRRVYPASGAGAGEGDIITGIELNRMALISGIIRDLPGTDPGAEDRFRVVLKDVGNSEVYIWGSYVPEEGAEPSATAAVVPPLSSWRLEYYIPPGTEDAGLGRTLPIFGVIAFVCLAIIGSAVYLYRESTREIREAYKKVSFVNQVSHELKTPLTNIRMYAELLQERIPGEDEKGEAYLGIVINESGRLSRLIKNVLTFAREQRNGTDFSPAEDVPDEIIREVLNRFRPSLEAKNIDITLDLHAGKPVWIDRDILEQIVSNLISNVEKYAASGRFLGISTSAGEGRTVIRVSDRGPGIPKGLREKVFSPFFRISDDSTEGIAGTGIGLSIVRSLALRHGGSAYVDTAGMEVRRDGGGGDGAAITVILDTSKQEGAQG